MFHKQTHTYTSTNTHIYTYIYTHKHAHTHCDKQTCTHTHTVTHTHTPWQTHTCTHTHTHTHTLWQPCACAHTHICVYVCSKHIDLAINCMKLDGIIMQIDSAIYGLILTEPICRLQIKIFIKILLCVATLPDNNYICQWISHHNIRYVSWS